ncbi:MAG: hypothetical protein MUC77_01870 [Chromatiaceae bacterium]|jgi:hypothetical protein|nr:hypothetical protein [Chromatiaceae bacterium]
MNHPLEAVTDFGPAELVLLATIVIALAGALFVVVRFAGSRQSPRLKRKPQQTSPIPR